MTRPFRRTSAPILLGIVCLFLAGIGPSQAAPDRVRFRVAINPGLVPGPVSGRLMIFMTASKDSMAFVSPTFPDLNAVWVCAREVSNLHPGEIVDVDPDMFAYPHPFSSAKPGDYQVMALLDTNHNYAYSGVTSGDLVGPIIPLARFRPDHTEPVDTLLTARVPDMPLRDSDSLRLAVLRSDLLSAFFGRPIEMRAGVFLPPSYATSPARRYPTAYYIHGFGATLADLWKNPAQDCCGPAPPDMYQQMFLTNWPEMIYVYLEASCPLGHHEFADSVNNGPWGSALVQEFIPYLEQSFRMESAPQSRLLTGHSSGGWSALWLQVSHSDFFGGAWASAPDPVDFRNWMGANLSRNPPDNFYHKNDGSSRWLLRVNGKDMVRTEEFAHWESVLGDFGGQLASFEAVFSPRGPDGRPLQLFNRDTGDIDPAVQKSWEKFDLSRKIRENWSELGPKLKGKIHVTVGTRDTVRLEEPVLLLDDTLKRLKAGASFTYLDGKDHFNLYEGGLARKMAQEMYAVARPGEPIPGTNTPALSIPTNTPLRAINATNSAH